MLALSGDRSQARSIPRDQIPQLVLDFLVGVKALAQFVRWLSDNRC